MTVMVDQQKLKFIYADTGCSLEDLSRAITNRDEWQEKNQTESMLSAQHDDTLVLFIMIVLVYKEGKA